MLLTCYCTVSQLLRRSLVHFHFYPTTKRSYWYCSWSFHVVLLPPSCNFCFQYMLIFSLACSVYPIYPISVHDRAVCGLSLISRDINYIFDSYPAAKFTIADLEKFVFKLILSKMFTNEGVEYFLLLLPFPSSFRNVSFASVIFLQGDDDCSYLSPTCFFPCIQTTTANNFIVSSITQRFLRAPWTPSSAKKSESFHCLPQNFKQISNKYLFMNVFTVWYIVRIHHVICRTDSGLLGAYISRCYLYHTTCKFENHLANILTTETAPSISTAQRTPLILT